MLAEVLVGTAVLQPKVIPVAAFRDGVMVALVFRYARFPPVTLKYVMLGFLL